MGRLKKYFTEEERKTASKENQKKWRAAHPDYQSEYYQANKEKIAERMAEYYQNNRDRFAEYQSTPKGRAVNLVGTYKQEDNKYNRGECTLTAEWVIEHIFSKPCHYCGKTDWHELGCDRINNALPHLQIMLFLVVRIATRKKQDTPTKNI